jgi:hypothetical protein
MAITLDGTNGINSSGVIVAPDGSASAPAITNDGDTNTGIFFPAADTIAFAEGGAEAMRIDSSGNVGIGTTTPTHLVTAINGNFGTITNSASVLGSGNTENIRIRAYNSSANQVGVALQSGASGSATVGLFGLKTGTNQAAFVVRQDNGTGTSAETMRIDSSGDLLFAGTTANTSGAGTWFEAPSDSTQPFPLRFKKTFSGVREAVDFRHSGTQVGRITFDNTSTAYVTSSDYRLKENVAPMTGALAKVLELKPVTYTWKVDGSAGEGFIAHELQAICPNAVVGQKDATEIQQVEVSPAVYEDVVIPAVLDEDGNEVEPERIEKRLVSEAVMEDREFPVYQGVDTSFLVATLTAAIQELKAQNDALEARIAALEGAQA